MGDCGVGGNCSRLEGNDQGIGAGWNRRTRHAQGLNNAHSVADKHERQVGGTRYIIGNTTEEERHFAVFFTFPGHCADWEP